MKYSTIIGLVLLAVGLVLYITLEPVEYTEKEFYIAGFLGLGVGLLIGGFLGFAQKKRKEVVETVFKPAEPSKTVVEDKETEDKNGLKF